MCTGAGWWPESHLRQDWAQGWGFRGGGWRPGLREQPSHSCVEAGGLMEDPGRRPAQGSQIGLFSLLQLPQLSPAEGRVLWLWSRVEPRSHGCGLLGKCFASLQASSLDSEMGKHSLVTEVGWWGRRKASECSLGLTMSQPWSKGLTSTNTWLSHTTFGGRKLSFYREHKGTERLINFLENTQLVCGRVPELVSQALYWPVWAVSGYEAPLKVLGTL